MKSTEHNRGLKSPPFVAGPKGEDKVPVNLTHGEAVLPVETVRKVGSMNIARLIADTTGTAPKQGLRRGGKYVVGTTPGTTGFTDDVGRAYQGVKNMAGGALDATRSAAGTVRNFFNNPPKPQGYAGLDNTRSANPAYQDLNGKQPTGRWRPVNPDIKAGPNMGPQAQRVNPANDLFGPQRPTIDASSEPVRGTPGKGAFEQPPAKKPPGGLRGFGRGVVTTLNLGDIANNVYQAGGHLLNRANEESPYLAAAANLSTAAGETAGLVTGGAAPRAIGALNGGLKLTTGNGVDDLIGKGIAKVLGPDPEGSVATKSLRDRIDAKEFSTDKQGNISVQPTPTQPVAEAPPRHETLDEIIAHNFENKDANDVPHGVNAPVYPPQNSSQKLRNPSFAPTGDGNVPRITPTRTNGGFYDIAAVPKGTGFIQRGDGPTHSFGTPSNSAQPTLQSGRQQVNIDGTPFKDATAYRNGKVLDYSKMDFPTLVQAYTRASQEGDTATLQGMRPLFAMAQTTAGHGVQYAQMLNGMRRANLEKNRDMLSKLFVYKDAEGKEQGGDKESAFYRHVTEILGGHGLDLSDVDPQTLAGLAKDFKLTNDVNAWNEGAVSALKSLWSDEGRPQKITSLYGKRVTPSNVGGVSGYNIEGAGWVPASIVMGGGVVGLGATDEASQDFIRDQQKAISQRPLDKGRQ